VKGTRAYLEVQYLEHLTTGQISEFLTGIATQRKRAPKSINRHRGALMRLINWAVSQHDVCMLGDTNPGAA
jgi:hypothetical protein